MYKIKLYRMSLFGHSINKKEYTSKPQERQTKWELKVKTIKWLFLLAKIAKKETTLQPKTKKTTKKEWN